MEEYTEKQRMEEYIDFSVEKEHGRVHREAKNRRICRLLCREKHVRYTEKQRMEGYIDFSVEKEHGKSIQRSNEWKGI